MIKLYNEKFNALNTLFDKYSKANIQIKNLCFAKGICYDTINKLSEGQQIDYLDVDVKLYDLVYSFLYENKDVLDMEDFEIGNKFNKILK